VLFCRDGERRFEGVFERAAGGDRPAVIILTEMFGVNHAMCEVAKSFAGRGYPAIVPNLFWRSEHPRALAYDGPDRDLAWTRLAAFDRARGVSDLALVRDWLRGQLGATRPVIVLGFCGGGLWAYLAASRETFDGAVSFYGLGIARYVDEIDRIRCPVQLHYGLADQHIPMTEIDAVTAAARTNANVEVFTYAGAGHSFFNPIRPNYDPAASRLAAARVDALLESLTVPGGKL
jgi:carboxymethylenebutenolidase